jgi:hypothetical protein
MHNSDGKQDAMLTFSTIAFLFIVVKFLLAGVVIEVEGSKYSLGEPDPSVIGAILGPTLGAYVTRKWTDKKYTKHAKEPDPVLPPDPRDEARESIS